MLLQVIDRVYIFCMQEGLGVSSARTDLFRIVSIYSHDLKFSHFSGAMENVEKNFVVNVA